MASITAVISSYFYIWRFDDPDEQNYEVYARNNDLTSFRLFTIMGLLLASSFLIVDLTRPVSYNWVLVFRLMLVIIYCSLLALSYAAHFSANGIQIVLVIQIIVSYILYFLQASLAKMPFFFLPNVILLFFYTIGTISGLRFRHAVFINLICFIVFTIHTEVQANEYYHSQYPNIISNLILSGVVAAFIEKQKRKDFMQFSEMLRRKEELDELNDQKNRVISILSHDVSSPLRSIGGLLTTYEKNQISKEELDHFLPSVKVRLDNVSFLVYSLVRWTKSQMKGFTVQRSLIDIEELIRENILLVKPLAGEKLISIEVASIPGLLVSADREMINLIIRNLLSNAIKFTSNGKRVTIRAFETAGNVLVQVSNEGDPIPDSVRETLFTFHTRSQQGTANEGGTGLGLAMSQQFALLNGGEIFLEPRTDNNNTFTLELPVQ